MREFLPRTPPVFILMFSLHSGMAKLHSEECWTGLYWAHQWGKVTWTDFHYTQFCASHINTILVISAKWLNECGGALMPPCVFGWKPDHSRAIKFTVHSGWSNFPASAFFIYFITVTNIAAWVLNLIKVQYRRSCFLNRQRHLPSQHSMEQCVNILIRETLCFIFPMEL